MEECSHCSKKIKKYHIVFANDNLITYIILCHKCFQMCDKKHLEYGVNSNINYW